MNKMQVKILNVVYDLEVEGSDELFIHSVASYLEKKMLKIQEETGIVDTQKVAVLAALNIADEFLRIRDSKENISGVLDKKADEFIRLLDRSLSS